MRFQSKKKKSKQPAEARENAVDYVAIGLGLAFDRLRERQESSGPIGDHSEAKTIISRISFDIHLKTCDEFRHDSVHVDHPFVLNMFY